MTARSAAPGPGTTLADLEDRAAIRTAMGDYFDAVNRGDWTKVTDGFVADAVLEYGTPGVATVERNVALLRAGTERLTSSSTLLGLQSCVDLDGDRARSETAALTAHCPASGDRRARLSMVRYEDEWIRCPDGAWRVSRRTVHHEMKAWCRLA